MDLSARARKPVLKKRQRHVKHEPLEETKLDMNATVELPFQSKTGAGWREKGDDFSEKGEKIKEV